MANQLQGLDSVDKKVVLQIFSAYGFGLIKGSIVVHATLMDKELLTPTFPIKNNDLKISSELIWYMDNAILKKLKMSNTSIRIECFHIPANKLSSTKRLGYILLKLKGAQTINSTSNDRVVNRSYKLIGSKNCNYNLTMSLRIENYNIMTTKTSLKKINKLKLINNKNINVNDEDFYKVEENDHYVESIEMDLLKPDADVDMLEILEQTNNSPEKYEPQNILNFDVQQKSIVDLEDWKNQQMILFNEKTKNKEEQLLKEFNNKWMDSRKRIEEQLTHEMLKCKAIAENMDIMADMLKKREVKITAKELELSSQKDSIGKDYIGIVQNVQFSNAQTINELSNHIFKLESILHSSEKTNMILKKENKQLKDDINSSCGLRMQQSKNKISNLERKCKDANKASMFYKEKWIASVKKINQMYIKLHGSISNEHLFNNRKNIQYVLTNQFDEQWHDEEKLRELLDELGKLRQDMNNTNYFDT